MTTASSAGMAEDRFHVTTTTGGAPRVMQPHGRLSPDRIPAPQGLADLGHRTVGGHRRAGSEGARDHRAAGRGHRPFERGLPAYERCRRQDLRRADPAVPHVVYRRNSASKSTFPPITARPCWEAIWAQAEPLGACAYGTEAMHILRAEKGYIIVGQDTDGTVTPDDAGAFLGGRQEEDGFRRHPRPEASRSRQAKAASSSSASSPRIRRWCWRRARRSSPIRTSRSR